MVNEELIFNFISPILGYEELTSFTMIDNNPESPFKWLQSIEVADVAFPITIPGYFGLDYQFPLAEEDAKKLEIVNAFDVLTLNIVNIPNGRPQDGTINLAGPLVINVETKKAMQLVLTDVNFSARHRLFNDPIVAPAPQKQEEVV